MKQLMENPLIVFEGANGTGKTTIAKLLCQETKFDYYSSVPIEFRSMQSVVEEQFSPAEKFRFYTVCNSIQMRQYNLPECELGVVADRYFFSTFVYNGFHLNSDMKWYWEEFTSHPEFRWPTICVYLTTSTAELSRRLNVRTKCAHATAAPDARLTLLASGLDQAFRQVWAMIPSRVIEVDTSERTVQSVLDELLSLKEIRVLL